MKKFRIVQYKLNSTHYIPEIFTLYKIFGHPPLTALRRGAQRSIYPKLLGWKIHPALTLISGNEPLTAEPKSFTFVTSKCKLSSLVSV